jgi:hypothetical protein
VKLEQRNLSKFQSGWLSGPSRVQRGRVREVVARASLKLGCSALRCLNTIANSTNITGMMKIFKVLIVIGGTVIGVPFLFILFLICFVSAAVTSSPTGKGDAFFVTNNGFLDTDIKLYVRDYALPDSKPIMVGVVSDSGGQGTPPSKAYWSKDGTIFAVRSVDSIGDWSHAYDFSNHKVLSNADWVSNAIAQLLRQRGGMGEAVISKYRRDKTSPTIIWNDFQN